MRSFFLGFRFALQGILNMLRDERNMKIHFLATLIVFFAGLYFGLSELEWVFVGLVVTLVIGFELINSALERICDLVNPDDHPLVRSVKDASAGAVLLVSMFALFVGYLIFFDRLVTLFSGGV